MLLFSLSSLIYLILTTSNSFRNYSFSRVLCFSFLIQIYICFMIASIYNERKYHTVIVCRTRTIDIGQKFPSAVFTKQGKILQNIEGKQDIQVNYGFNAVKYQYGNTKIVVGEAKFLMNILTQQEKQKFDNSQYLPAQSLETLEKLLFYLFLEDETLVQISIDIIFKEGIVILKPKPQQNDLIKEESFKRIAHQSNFKQLNSCQEYQALSTYVFQSQFAILSSQHFLNCFINGINKISYYVKKGEGYIHSLDKKLLSTIKARYLYAKL